MGYANLARLKRIWMMVLVAMWALLLNQGEGALLISFNKTPPNRTRERDAWFGYSLTDENGRNPCANNCTFSCQIDAKVLNPCYAGGILIMNVPVNQEHTFSLNVTASTGEHNSSIYSWFVDTVPPTASVSAAESFTNAVNILVDITFSEPCPGHGGFKCTSVSECDLIVNGPAEVVPSSLRKLENNLKYSIIVALSMKNLFGRVVLDMARSLCTDQAGNSFVKGPNSSFVIHFDRRPVLVNLWTAIPELELDVNHVPRTSQATNQMDDLRIYLDFNDPVVNSTEEILSVLQPSTGFLRSIHRRSHGNRRFGFQLTNLSKIAAVTVNLQSKYLIGRTGTPVSSPAPVIFLYDTVRPEVHLSTNSPGKTKEHSIAVLIEFTEPVFTFDSSGVTVHGGRIARFKELSKTAYILNVLIAMESVVSVFVPENKASDIAGNLNLASNQLSVRRYSAPAISVALYSLTTAGLLATSFAATVLSLSSATLAAAGALTSGTASFIITDPSRNLLGMAGHLQVFAFSDWLSVSLPIEYRETTKGLRWLIPHAKLPWKMHDVITNTFDSQFVVNDSPDISTVKHKRSLISAASKYRSKRDQYSLVSTSPCSLFFTEEWRKTNPALKQSLNFGGQTLFPHNKALKKSSGLQIPSLVTCEHAWRKSWNAISNPRIYRERKLGVNSTMYGPALELSEYLHYFVNQSENLSAVKLVRAGKKYTGWQDFGMNMFWLGVVGGALIVLHMLILVFLKWRTKTSLRGALSIPRFELFLLILTLPCMCQASAFIIRGGTTAGIAVGVILLALPAAFLLSVFLFLTVAVFMGDLAQYKEIRCENEKVDLFSKIFSVFVGRNAVGKWFRKEGLPSSFLSRFGILFEDRKGPAKLVFVDGDNLRRLPKWIDSGTNGIGRMRAVNSDDDIEDTVVSPFQRVIGSARSAYLIVDLIRRVTLGIIFGAYPSSDHSWSQIGVAFGFTVFQLLYIVLLKPYIRRGVQMVESICLICEAGIFAAGLVLLADGHYYDDHKGIGIFMLVLLLISFVSQLVNEWYALMKCLVSLAPSPQPSLKLGVKMLLRGVFLPFIPHEYWSKFVTPESSQPKTGLVPVVPFSPEGERERRTDEMSQNEPPLTVVAEDIVPTYHPGSPCFIDPRTISPGIIPGESDVPASSEIRPESSPKTGQIWNQWNRTRSLEGKRSKGTKSDPRINELKMLRELAKASFPGGGKDENPTEMAGCLELGKASPSSAPREVMKPNTGSVIRTVYSQESSSDDNSEASFPTESPLHAPGITSLGAVTGASGSVEKLSRQDTMSRLG